MTIKTMSETFSMLIIKTQDLFQLSSLNRYLPRRFISEAYLESCQTSTMEFFFEKIVNGFKFIKAASHMFDRVLNKTLHLH